MSASNLAIVFGPTLLSPPMPAGDANGAGAMPLQDMSYQCKAVETILEKYKVRLFSIGICALSSSGGTDTSL